MARRDWADLEDEDLLDVRLCDLGLRLEGTWLEERLDRLHEELERHDLRLRPHAWLSNEWFSPDGVPGIAVPFFLAHARLRRLEHRMMLQVEGGGDRECMKLLRHEAGHCLCSAHRLHYRRRWREVFGRFGQPYPDEYSPKPSSRDYVVHLDDWYAQAHPAEDFAETFAVWLRPKSRWRQEYQGWPALRKIEYVDELMGELAGQAPTVRSRRKVEPLSKLRQTLREHYEIKRAHYGAPGWSSFYDRDLRRVFDDGSASAGNETAAAFLRRHRKFLREVAGEWTGLHHYTTDHVVREMIDRCKELRLRLTSSKAETKNQASLLVTVHAMKMRRGRRQRIAL